MLMNELLLQARQELIDNIRRELLGPGSEYSIPDEEHEIITDLPEIRYSIGILFPQKNLIHADNDEIPPVLGTGSLDDPDEYLQEAVKEEDDACCRLHCLSVKFPLSMSSGIHGVFLRKWRTRAHPNEDGLRSPTTFRFGQRRFLSHIG